MVGNKDNADEICAAINVSVKSSYGQKIIILKSKIQKNICHQTIHEKGSCGDKVVALNLDSADKYVLIKMFISRRDSFLEVKNVEKYVTLKY